MTYDDLVEIALRLPDTSEELFYGGASVKRGDRWMFSLKKDGETVALKLAWDDHDRLLEAHPEIVYKTPHYEGYPAFLIRLELLTPALAEELARLSWEDAPRRRRSGEVSPSP